MQRCLTPPVRARRATLLALFLAWLRCQHALTLTDLHSLACSVVGRISAEYGQFCFEAHRSLGTYSETILAVVDQCRHLRRELTLAWDVAYAWKCLCPASHHIPVPEVVFLAMCSLCILWDWPDVLVLILLDF